MRISKLRRTLAVFLSALMITLSVPFTAITASAEVQFMTEVSNGTTTRLYKGDSLYNDTIVISTVYVYYAWKDYSNSSYSTWKSDTAVAKKSYNCVPGDPFQIPNSASDSNVTITTSSYWTVANSEIDGNDFYIYVKSDTNKPGYTLTFNSNYGSNTTTSKTGVTSYTISSADSLTRTGFAFLGWAESSTATTAQYTVGSSVTLTANKTLYAVWEHTAHVWNYSASDNVITAKCSETDCQYYTTGETLTLNADATFEYNESAYDKASVTPSSNFPVTVSNSDIQYEGTGTTSYGPSAAAPTNVGTYKAAVTVEGKTAEKAFEITPGTMSGITTSGTYDYDGNEHGLVVNAPTGATVTYGTTDGDYSLSSSPTYINAGTYPVYYKVTKENYADVTGSANVVINKAAYTGTSTASKGILAGVATSNATVTLPAIPENMSYGIITYTSPVTSAFISDGVLTFSTDDTTVDGNDYTITIPIVGGTGANYIDYNIIVTLHANTCTHPYKQIDWTSDSTGHWHKCPDCSAKVDFAAHTPANAVEENRVEATCTVDGSYDEVVYCEDCDYEISRTPKTIDATGHSFTTYVPDGNANCTTDGTKTAECDNGCGETDTVADPDSATGHAWSTAYTNDTQYHWHECGNANCPITNDSDKDGYAAHISGGPATEDNDEHCTVCGYVINPALDHVCRNNVPTFVPEVSETCTTDGVKAHYKCRCGKLYSDSAATTEVTSADLIIPAHHTWSDAWSHDDTQHYHLCTVCGDKNDAALHSFDDGVVITEPTEDTEGEKKLTCTVCNYSKTVSIPSLKHEHDYTTQKHDSEYHWNECRCGDISDKALHTYGDWTITKPATSTADGVKERTCSVCGYVQTDTVKYVPDDDNNDDDNNDDIDTGDINNTTNPDSNACHGDTELTKQEIIEKFDLTPEELDAVKKGEDINVFLKVEDNTTSVSASDKALTESVLGSIDKVAMYLDIKLFKQIGNNAPTQVSNTNGAITIVFEMPESFINYNSNIERTYYIVRVHNGVADKINGVFDIYSRKFKFSTDKFSSYAIVYSDTVKAVSDPDPDPTPDPTPGPMPTPTPTTPDTGYKHTHVHKLEYDETGHWKQCSCGDKKDFAEHQFGEWEVVKVATSEEEGLEKRTCTVCGYSETAPLIDVASGAGITAEDDSINTTGKTTAFFISITAIAALGAAAFVVRRKIRK